MLGTIRDFKSLVNVPTTSSFALATSRSHTDPFHEVPPNTPSTMPEIEMPDPDDLGGNVTKPFKFVTGQ